MLRCFLVVSRGLAASVVQDKFPGACVSIFSEDAYRDTGRTWVVSSERHSGASDVSQELGLGADAKVGGIVVELTRTVGLGGWVSSSAWAQVDEWLDRGSR